MCMSWPAVGAAQLGARGRGTLGSDADADALPTHALLGLGVLAGAGHVPTADPGPPPALRLFKPSPSGGASSGSQLIAFTTTRTPTLPAFCSLIFSVALAVARRPPSIDGVLACRARREERLKGSRTHKQVARCRTARRPASTSSSPSSCRRSGSSSSSAAGLSSGSASSSPSSATSPASSTPSGSSPSSQPEHRKPRSPARQLASSRPVI